MQKYGHFCMISKLYFLFIQALAGNEKILHILSGNLFHISFTKQFVQYLHNIFNVHNQKQHLRKVPRLLYSSSITHNKTIHYKKLIRDDNFPISWNT